MTSAAAMAAALAKSSLVLPSGPAPMLPEVSAGLPPARIPPPHTPELAALARESADLPFARKAAEPGAVPEPRQPLAADCFPPRCHPAPRPTIRKYGCHVPSGSRENSLGLLRTSIEFLALLPGGRRAAV